MEVVQSCFRTRNVFRFSFNNCRGCSMLVHIPCSETHLHNLNLTLTTMKTNLFDVGTKTRLYNPALKQKSTSIAPPLQLWKLGFRIFLVMKDACTNSTTVRMTLSGLPGTDTGIHKHGTTSTVVKTEFEHIHGSKTRLHNFQRTTTVVHKASHNLYSCGN